MIKLTFWEHIKILLITIIELFIVIVIFFGLYKIFDFSKSFNEFYLEGLIVYVLIQLNILYYTVFKNCNKN